MSVLSSLTDNINVHYYPSFIDKYKANKYMRIFERDIVYNSAEDSKVKIMGKEFYIPRKQVAYGEPGVFYRFSGIKVHAKSWHENNQLCTIIRKIKKQVELFTGQTFNFVLINRYADGNQCIGEHSDDERELGDNPAIVGVSFGAERDIIFKSKKGTKTHTLNLENGSIFVMYDPTNKHWKHSIPRRSSIKTPRISFTFRNMII